MNHKHLSLLVAALLAASAPAGAQLVITELLVAADTRINNNGVISEMSLIDIDPGPLPFALAANSVQPGQVAVATQNKGGFFSESVSGTLSAAPLSISAGTTFYLTVTTTMADTPLVLDFRFLGASIAGSTYYGQGDVTVLASAAIFGGSLGGPFGSLVPPDWSFEDQLILRSNVSSAFQRQSNGADVQNIGLPQDHYQQGWNGFESQASLTRDAFVGRLDFGLLQPGQFFSLVYEAEVEIVASDARYGGGRASASLVDPFSLATRPAFQFSLQGLELPAAPVPEPASWLLMALGMAWVGWRQRPRQIG